MIPDLEVALVARGNEQLTEPVSVVVDGTRPLVTVDIGPGGTPLVEGAVWVHRVDLNAWADSRDAAWELIRRAHDAFVTPLMSPGWTAGGIDVSACLTQVAPYYLPDPVSGDHRCITTVQLTYSAT